MNNLLDIIRDELKDVHIEDGTKVAFDQVCNQLNERLSVSSVYEMGVRSGKERLRDSLKDLLDIHACHGID